MQTQSPLTRFFCDLEPTFSSRHREGEALTNGVINVNVPVSIFQKKSAQNNLYSRKPYSRVLHSATFRHYSVSLFLKCSLKSSGGKKTPRKPQKTALQEAAERGAQSCYQKKMLFS